LKVLKEDKIILGIDPGTNIMGYGLIHCKDNKISLIALGEINLSKYLNHALKLKAIFEKTIGIIDQYKPDELAIEAPFFGKNVQSMLKLGRAQGVAIAAALYKNMPICEYSPKKIKLAITGNGNATKEQVAEMLYTILKEKFTFNHLDATDGLAVAVCHYFQKNVPKSDAPKTSKGKKTASNWSSFITQNPERIVK